MPSLRRWGLVVGCLVVLGGVAWAGDPLARPASPKACEYLDQGNTLYDLRSFEDAIKAFRAGAVIEEAAVFDFNLGQASRQLGKYEDAIWYYERFVDIGHPAGEDLATVQELIKEMRAHLADRARTMPPNDPARPRSDAAKASPSGPPGTDWFGWGVTGFGIAAMGAGGAVLLSASHLSDQANMAADTKRRDQLHDQARTRSTVGAVIGIGGIAATVAGAIKLLLHAHAAEPAASAALALGVSSNGAYVVGRF